MAGPATRRIDGRGRLVVPGLIDGHAHMDREGLKRSPALARRLPLDRRHPGAHRGARRRDTRRGEWIVTMPIGEPPFYEGVPR